MENQAKVFDELTRFMPLGIRPALFSLGNEIKIAARELRLRCGQAAQVVTGSGVIELPHEGGDLLCEEDLAQSLEFLSDGSPYAVADELKNGFLTVKGGHRAGICGRGVIKDGRLVTLRDISSINLRIAREVRSDAARTVTRRIMGTKDILSTVIISPPGGGKTTMLREIARLISNGEGGERSVTVAIADERGEIAAMHRGRPIYDVGTNTDVMDAIPKAEAMGMLIRTMTPRVLVADELGGQAEAAVAAEAARSGVAVITTAHGRGIDDLKGRRDMSALLSNGIFRLAVVLDGSGAVGTLKEISEL